MRVFSFFTLVFAVVWPFEQDGDYEIEINYGSMNSRCLVEVPEEVNWEAASMGGHTYSELFGYEYDLDVEEEP